jgi:3',5'-cyclic AMP phosphodiesterase CpdA
MLIAQLSDVHVGGGRYREELLRAAIEEINTAAPDLVVVAGVWGAKISVWGAKNSMRALRNCRFAGRTLILAEGCQN